MSCTVFNESVCSAPCNHLAELYSPCCTQSQQVPGAGQRDGWELRIALLEQLGGRGRRQHVQRGSEGV